MCGEIVEQTNNGLCKKCRQEVRVISDTYCIKCGEPLLNRNEMYCERCHYRKHFYDRAVGVFEHDGVVRDSIYNYKFKNIRVNARFYARQAYRVQQRFFERTLIEAIIPVPVHKSREQERGYNQAAVFGRELSKITGIPCYENILTKTSKTKSQKKLSENMRYSNLKKAFEVDKEKLSGMKTILVVDDIYTTGSTVDACSYILKKSGVQKVYVMCISRGVDIYYNKK